MLELSGDIYLNQEVNYTVFTLNDSLSTHLIASMFSFIAHEPQLSIMTPTHIWHRILVYLYLLHYIVDYCVVIQQTWHQSSVLQCMEATHDQGPDSI